MDYDAILEHIGQFGRYQKQLYYLTTLTAVFAGLVVLSYSFTGIDVNHRCKVPACEEPGGSSLEDAWFLNFTIPPPPSDYDGDLDYHECKRYVQMPNASGLNNTCSPEFFTTEKEKCDSWIFDDSTFESTTVTEFKTVCDDVWLQSFTGSAFMLGKLFGASVFGDLSDRFGRKNTLMLSILGTWLPSWIGMFSNSIYMFLSLRFLAGFAEGGLFQTAFVISLELAGASYRMYCGIAINFFYAIGELLVAPLAIAIPNWRWLQFTCSFFMVVLFGYYWLLPESVRWLVSKGRIAEAKKIMLKAAEVNKKSIPQELLEEMGKKTSEGKKGSFIDLFRTPILRWRTINMFIQWFVSSGVYYGLSMNSTNLSGDVFLNYTLSMLIEIPANLLAIFTLDRFGRRPILILCMLVGGIACLGGGFIDPDNKNLQPLSITLSLIGKMCITSCFGIVYVYTAELYPTYIRNVAVGSSSTFSRFGSVLSPYMAALSEISQPLPMIIFGVLSITAGVLALFLPETNGLKLPETVEEAESIKLHSPFKRKKKTSNSYENKAAELQE